MLVKISAEELVEEIMSGKRDFEKIILPKNSDLRRFIPILEKYLRGQNLCTYPLNFSYSKIVGIKAPRIYIPYSHMYRTDMRGADMCGADMIEAEMTECDMRGANMTGADISGANMTEADIRGIKGLEKVLNLETVIFRDTIVTPKEKDIIEIARKKLNSFDVRDK